MSRRRITLGIAADLYDRLAITASQLALVPALVHAWGLHLYGCWVLLATIPGFLALADLGFGGAAYVRMTTLIARGERDRAVGVLHTAVAMTLIASVGVAATAWVLIALTPAGWLPVDPRLSSEDARAVLMLLVVYAMAVLQANLQTVSLRSIGRFPLGAVLMTHTILLEAALVAIAAMSGHGPVVAAAALATGRILGMLAQHLTLRRVAPWLRIGLMRASRAEAHAMAGPALAVLAIPLGQATVLQGSVIALGAAAGPAAAPAFAAARTLARVGLQFTQLVTHAVMTDFTAAAAREDRGAQARLLLAVAGAVVAAAIPVAVAIGVAGPWLMARWTGGAILPPPGLMPVIAVTVLLGGAWQPLSVLMLAINRQAAFSVPYLLLGAASLGVTYLLALRFGAVGAAATMVTLDAAMCAIVGRFVVRHWLRGLPLAEAAREALAQGRGTIRRARGLGGR